MSAPSRTRAKPVQTLSHEHEPVVRVIRASWADPLDISYSRKRADNRWNPPDAFGVLYTCCSEKVARAVTLDIFKLAGVEFDDLAPPARPQLVEISWKGEVADVASPEGIAAAGFPPTYPVRVALSETQAAAQGWHRQGSEGVVCRSASMARLGFSGWAGPHEGWGELAVFVEKARIKPRLARRRRDLTWLQWGSPQPVDSSQQIPQANSGPPT